MMGVHLFAGSAHCRRSLWLIEGNVVGVAEFNSSDGRLERSVCGRGEGDAKMCAESSNSCGQSGTTELSGLSLAPPGERKP